VAATTLRAVKRFLKWAAVTIASIVAVLLIVIYAGSEYRLRQRFDVALAPLPVPTDSASLARGQHVYQTRGCAGCHGEGMAGEVFFDEPMVARLVAPNVVRAIRGYSDPELARLLRHGVRPNGQGVAVMPSSMLFHLDDADLGSLIAYLRTLPDKGSDALPSTSIRFLARVGLVTGQYKLEPLDIAHDAPRAPNGPDPAAKGLYIAKSTCTECHGQKLEGGETTPALSVVAAYSPAEFSRLMREGTPRDSRKLDLMARVARSRFVHLSDDEVNGLYAYLSRQLTTSTKTGG
jgi:mono/diheme cytochrome c family protein